MSTRRVPRRRTYRKVNGSKTMHKVARQEARRVVKKEIETKLWEGSTSTSAVTGLQYIDDNGRNFLLTKDFQDQPITGSSGVSIEQGLTSGSYIGLTIQPVYVSINISITNATGMTGDNFNTYSVMVIQGKGSFVFDPVSTQNQLTYNNSLYAPLGFIPREFNDRYKVLYHKRVVTDADDPTKTFNIRIPSKKLRKIHFTNGLGTIEANPLVLSVISDSGSEAHPALLATWRLYYKDA